MTRNLDRKQACSGNEAWQLDPIAITGMAVRLPGGVHNTSDFWNMLVNKKSGLTKIPKERWDNDGFYSDVPKWGTIQNQECYLLSDVDLKKFDTSFFTCGQAEAERMDPMQRQLLEITQECLDSAGETATSTMEKQVGCYVGTFSSDWQDDQSMDPHASGVYRGSGYLDFFQANRISYEYNWTGPSMLIKTGCSSSMVALHLAAEAVQSGACTSAMALGCNLITSVLTSIIFTETGVLSHSGKCKTFDALADGYGRGEAVNAVYVKKLSDALRDGNPVRAIIRASATNNDGRSRGIMTPNDVLQERLIRQVYSQANISDFSKTAFFECHGTGTPTGDPLEASAVARIWGPCGGVLMGAVKPNVGHSEGAAGLTSVIKAVLALENRMIPPNIYLEHPNPKIPWESAKLRVPTEPELWPDGKAERISVNSFGVSGSNAHIILESYRHDGTMNSPVGSLDSAVSFQLPSLSRLLLFSAAHPESLEKQIEQHREYLEGTKDVDLDGMAYTLGLHRNHLNHRSYAIVDSHGAFDVSAANSLSTEKKRITFIYTGQGVHWAGMGKALLDLNDVFRSSIQKMDNFLQSLPEPPAWTIENELRKGETSSLVGKRGYSHPCATAVQLALTDLLFSLGIHPHAVTAHSGGEAAAAYATGAISAEQAMAVAYLRGWILVHGDVPPGTMAAVALGSKEIEPYLIPGVVIGCKNSPMSTTISGDPICIQHCVDQIARRHPDVKYKVLDLETSFHSPWIEPLATTYAELLRPYIADTKAPSCPHFSSVTGKAITTADFNIDYWVDNFVLPVEFEAAVRNILSTTENNNVFIEVGPHPALQGPVKDIMRKVNPRASYKYITTLKRREDSNLSLLRLVGDCFSLNLEIDLHGIFHKARVLSNLPSYPWYHATNYMFVPRTPGRFRRRRFPRHALLGSPVLEGTSLEPAWRNMLDIKEAAWLFDHVVNGSTIFPAAAYVAMVGEAMRQTSEGRQPYTIRDMKFSTALSLPKDRRTELYTRLIPEEEENNNVPWYHFKIMSSSDGDHWVSHCTGLISSGAKSEAIEDMTARAVKKMQDGVLPRKVDVEEWYKATKKLGIDWRASFQGLDDITAGTVTQEAAATVFDFDDTEFYTVHPTVLDQLLQINLVAMTNGLRKNLTTIQLPTNIGYLTVFDRPDLEMRVYGEQRNPEKSHNSNESICSALLFSCSGRPGVSLDRLAFAELPSAKKGDRLLGSYFAWDRDISMVNSIAGIENNLTLKGNSGQNETYQLNELCRIISLFGWKYPDAQILEIGDGNLEVTKVALDALHPDQRHRFFSTYKYACTAEQMRESVSDELAGREEDNISVIGAEEVALTGPVDMIVLSQSFLCNDSMIEERGSLGNILQPWGRLLIHGLGQESPSNFEYSENQISDVFKELEQLGFTEHSSTDSGLIFAHRPERADITTVTLITTENDRDTATAKAIQAKFIAEGCQIDVRHDTLIPTDSPLVIYLRDLVEPTIYNLIDSTFSSFMESICKFRGSLIWVTPSAHSSVCKDPRTAMAHGVLRTVHMEYNIDATVVEVDTTSSNGNSLSDALWKICQSLPTRRKTVEFDPDVDYAIVDGVVQVPRMIWFGLHDEGLAIPLHVEEVDGEAVFLFREDVTYLLVGGMGGIGRSVAIWMAENGARNFVFFSRTAGEPQHEDFRKEIESYPGCLVKAVSGDVAKYADVQKAVAEAPSPIAGVMQLSLILCDNATAQMTFEEWQTAVKPRVHGTWNLHEAMLEARTALDFFVVFGSGGGITGYHGQANYSAANTYLDAFVAYRQGLGLPASILDIGVVGDVGYLTEQEKQYAAFRNAGYVFLTENDVLDATAIAVARSRDRNSPMNCFCVGALSDIPFNDPANRLNWKRDVRCALSHHFHQNAATSKIIGGGHASLGNNGASDDTGEIEALITLAKLESEKIECSGAVEGLARMLGRELSRLLLRPVDQFLINSELPSIGLDSIVSIELVDWIQQQFHLGMSSIEVTQCSSLMHLAETILEHLAQGR
ncbi:polyketide synthase [Colletotrichum tofieldiae]|uniref:Polyketide synthase n=1 Tax=Colletotrichum tofieldiae TaxID=708197 RepID=A0A166S1W4_9PEZI|nr:polyketide synthase [Colletotrichum tofieldiae]